MDPASVSELLVSTLQKQCTDETTAIGKAFSESGLQLISRALPKCEGEKLFVSFQLTADQQALLRRNFPGRDIHFAQRDSSSHSFAAAHRLLETDFIYKCFGTTHEPILDLGGNFVSHLKRQRYNVHSCCPPLDDRDGARFTERFMTLRTYHSTHVEERHEADFCQQRFEQCPKRALYAMAVHATSDLPLTELRQALANKGTRKMIMSIMMDPNMLIRDKGFIPNFNVNWEIDHEADEVQLDFVDAPCLGYRHKFSVLRQYLTTNAVIVGKSQAYRIERKSDFGGVFIIDITEVAGYHPGMSVGQSRSCAWLSLLKSKTIVNTVENVEHYWFDVERRSKVLVDTKVLTKVLEASFRQYKPTTEPKAMIQNIATMLSSSTNFTIINGVTLQAGESLQFDDYIAVATTIYVRTKRVYDKLDENVKSLGTIQLEDIDTRNPISTIGSVLHGIFCRTTYRNFTAKNGNEIEEVLKASVSKDIRSLMNFVIGKQGRNGALLTDPTLFIPLTIVLETEWKITNSLTVDKMKETILYPLFDRLETEKIEKREQIAKSEAFSRSVDVIAKWVEAHPKGELPKGLGDISKFLPETPDMKILEPETSRSNVINKYSSEIEEAIMYYETEMDTNDRKLKSIGDHCEWSTKSLTTIWSGDDSRRVYVPRNNKWYGPNTMARVEPTAQYERGLTKEGYIPIYWDGDLLHVDETCRKSLLRFEAIFFDRSCEFAAGLRLVPALKKALSMEAKFERKLVDGIAGCGKTTKILAEGKLTGEEPDLFLTSNKSSAVELREKIVGSAIAKSVRVRTVDSFLMNGRNVKSKRVIFDECFLQHAGSVYAAATLAEAESLVMFGDTQQIPFVSRIPHIRLKSSKVGADEKRGFTMTYRSPADATHALSKWFYRKNIRTANRRIRSLRLRPIVSVSQIETGYDLYLTHTQAEKHSLIASGRFDRRKIFTTGEAQGKTVGKVAFVRLTRTSIHLYTGKDPLMGPCHGLVALSRHTEKFDYFTVADCDSDDIIAKAIRDVGNESDDKVWSYVHNDHKL
uniref:Replication protein 1a n=1 Tax=Lilac leaf chlorosis virus TaxID=722755 RepID=A0A3S6H180_9BROM|nr:methyltransferase/helicase [Lilac leaf chlorosis virus]